MSRWKTLALRCFRRLLLCALLTTPTAAAAVTVNPDAEPRQPVWGLYLGGGARPEHVAAGAWVLGHGIAVRLGMVTLEHPHLGRLRGMEAEGVFGAPVSGLGPGLVVGARLADGEQGPGTVYFVWSGLALTWAVLPRLHLGLTARYAFRYATGREDDLGEIALTVGTLFAAPD